MNEKFIEIVENLGWRVCSQNGDFVEIENFSPAGENLVYEIDITDPYWSAEKLYSDFDIDEHVIMWIDAKRNGVLGIPSISRLVKDAGSIKKMLKKLACALVVLL